MTCSTIFSLLASACGCYARFKRIGDKRGWGAPEYRAGLEVDRSRFLNDWKLSQAGARLAELAADGCEIVSYKKEDAPGGMVTYIPCFLAHQSRP